uniref:Uncharacterized protein n=1 Tax=Arundo donax TaxID=35708 RepID=A0A0A9BFK7_ARUDO
MQNQFHRNSFTWSEYHLNQFNQVLTME